MTYDFSTANIARPVYDTVVSTAIHNPIPLIEKFSTEALATQVIKDSVKHWMKNPGTSYKAVDQYNIILYYQGEARMLISKDYDIPIVDRDSPEKAH